MPDPALKTYLDKLVTRFEHPDFIADDPIALPHAFDDPRDQEVIGLYAALLAWGRRATILNKMNALCERMDYRPFAFVRDYTAAHAERLADFKHRTFQPIDAHALTQNLATIFQKYGSLEALFMEGLPAHADHIGPGIEAFSSALLTARPDTPDRLRKHVARPSTGSACKRLCMYLRWMVRSGPVDLHLWRGISPAQLVLPLDVHSGTQARALGLLHRSQNDWQAALELTAACRTLDAKDPCRYDLALFGLGVSGGGSVQ